MGEGSEKEKLTLNFQVQPHPCVTQKLTMRNRPYGKSFKLEWYGLVIDEEIINPSDELQYLMMGVGVGGGKGRLTYLPFPSTTYR